MSTNSLLLFCLVDGEPTSCAFPVSVSTTTSIGELKELIRTALTPQFDDILAKDLTLWSVTIADSIDTAPISIKNVLENEREQLKSTSEVSIFGAILPADTIHVIVQPPHPDPQYLPRKKKVRIEEAWQPFTASDGSTVELPPSWIDILTSPEFVPEPRAAFVHLKGDLQPGDAITVPSMGQLPKQFGGHGQDLTLFVTEQMLELWEDMRGDKERTHRRVLSGPMGVGKSYLSYFLAARAYAEGWIILYVSDAGLVNEGDENLAALDLVKRFLALNKVILTGSELQMLVSDYDGSYNITRKALLIIFGSLLRWDRKRVLLVDEHGKLFKKMPYLPDKFTSLFPLSSFNWWDELYRGTRLIFTGTAHAKYELAILPDSYRPTSVISVGPLSTHVFSKLLDMYPRLQAPGIRNRVTEIANRVPRELVNLSAFLEYFPDPISMENLQEWMAQRAKGFLAVALEYYQGLDLLFKHRFYNALLQMFLGSTSIVDFEWDFLDLGLIYRSRNRMEGGTQHHILCRPAQMALLELFKSLPLPEITKKPLCDGSLSGDQFVTILCHQLICTAKPILLNATDLDGGNPTTITLDFSHCETLRNGMASLGVGHEKVLTRGYEGYPRFDFMLGPMFIQVSVNDFGKHNTGLVNLSMAFKDRDGEGTNQIERYLNDMFGPGHSARIVNNRFAVTKNGVPVPGFHIVYIRGSPGRPAHREWVSMLPDVLHVSFEELMENLFKNIV
ncbi:hypothetical protein BGW41_006502 [Actinomortierella wolfii]|nr:hypothetical protein BGW41_006502 [Actinomortierella wolfii]